MSETLKQLKNILLQNCSNCDIIQSMRGAMSTSNRKYKDSVFVDRQRLYIRVQSLTSSFEQSSKHRICVEPPPSVAVI